MEGWTCAKFFVSFAERADNNGRINALEFCQLIVQVGDVFVYLIKARQPLILGAVAVAELVGVLAQVRECALHQHRVGVATIGALRLLQTIQETQAGAGRLGNGIHVAG